VLYSAIQDVPHVLPDFANIPQIVETGRKYRSVALRIQFRGVEVRARVVQYRKNIVPQ
jgi:hypothetical protein